MLLSFVVPAHNEEFELPATLAALQTAARGSAQEFEIIVVDDASTDRTAALARAAGTQVVTIQRRQIAAARNAGAAVARGDIFFFVDADTRITTQHILLALAALRDGCAGGSARVALDGFVPMWARVFLAIFSAIYFGSNLGAGAFIFTTRENFQRIGGFDEQYFAGEETFLSIALKRIGKFKILREPILTSGRKLRMYSARQILWKTIVIAVRGQAGLRARKALAIWYDGKREKRLA